MDEPESKKLEKYIIKMAIEAKELIVHAETSGNNSDNKRKWNNNASAGGALFRYINRSSSL